MEESNGNYQIFSLGVNKELRFVIGNISEPVTVELLDGDAEICGADMILNKAYTLSFSFAVATMQGCELKLLGRVSSSYRLNRSTLVHNLHSFLEDYRNRAEENCVKGPITLIVGPTDVGKSTLCHSLLNYAAGQGRAPLFIDLDVGQSSVSVPGTISILPIREPLDPVKGFNESEISVYYFGYKSPGFNIILYYLLIDRLGKTLNFRMSNSKHIAVSGAIIDTCGWVNGQGYEAILVAARSFDVNTVIVVSDNKLHHKLKHDLPTSVEIKFISKLHGIKVRRQTVRRQNRDNLVMEYFYGFQYSLKPHIFQVKFSDIKIFKVSSPKVQVKLDMLDDVQQYIYLIPMPISPELVNHVLAVSHADDGEDIALTSVLGFVHVQNVDMDCELLTILSPQPSPLPKKFLVMGDLQFEIEAR